MLTFDKRGHGISGGLSADNALQQGLDMLRALDALPDGTRLRLLAPDGRNYSGPAAARQLTASPGAARTMPVVLGGSSQGSWTTEWAMTANFNRWCSLDLPGEPCHRPWGHTNIGGAILLADLWSFASFGLPQTLPAIAANAQVDHYVLVPPSDTLAQMPSTPTFAPAPTKSSTTFADHTRDRVGRPQHRLRAGPNDRVREKGGQRRPAHAAALHQPQAGRRGQPPYWEPSTQRTRP